MGREPGFALHADSLIGSIPIFSTELDSCMTNETKKIKILLTMIKMAEQMNDEWISTLNKCLGSTAEEKERINHQVTNQDRIDDKE